MRHKNIFIRTISTLILLIILSTCIWASTISNSYNNINYNTDNKLSILDNSKININEWINIPTYDGSGETTHPKVIYFDKKFNGYKYWMVNTPYPGNDAYKENPSIIVSNDGTNWIEPKGIKNPVSGYPSKVRDDSYYSDPFILFDKDHFELFFRKTRSKLNGKYMRNGYNYLYFQTSKDGISWSEPKMILDNKSKERYMSISVIKQDDIYKMWYVNYDGRVRYIESPDLIYYTEPLNINIKNFKMNVWHGEIQYKDNKYVYIFMVKYALYYTESKDGINFDEPRLIPTKLKSLDNVIYYIYKTSFIISDDYVELYIPYRVKYKWQMYYSKMSKDKFFEKI